ncbi:MAG TPA: winged helix DNA-binding domain-containing protein [bacterium (Candidatus Stahlbacteria)]|nr:winged helix DNA-binding domain-containing protein [Candidatus Stahlbacteria bacterium]
MAEPVIRTTVDQIRRFTLDRHLLIKKTDKDLVSAIGQVCGLNSQTARAPYISLWSRVQGFKRSDYDKALYQDRILIKTWLMRGTVHTVPTKEFTIYQKAVGRNLYEKWKKSLEKYGLMPLDKRRTKLEQRLLDLLDQGSFTKKELLGEVKGLLKGYREREEKIIVSRTLRTLAYQGLICHGEPTGPWYHFKENRFTAVNRWAPEVDLERMEENEARDRLLIKYLKGYGPATVNDFAYWSGMAVTEAKGVFDRLKSDLIRVEVRGVKGDYWIHKRDGRRLTGGNKRRSNVIFLPEFDPLIMGHKEKVRILDEKYKKRVFLRLADVAPVIIADGQVIGTWNYRFSDKSLKVLLFKRIDKKVREKIDKEKLAIKKFLESD